MSVPLLCPLPMLTWAMAGELPDGRAPEEEITEFDVLGILIATKFEKAFAPL